jgi:hypothetical protein
MHYNFARIHKTLRITPAMATGVSNRVRSLDEIVGLLDANETRTAAWRRRCEVSCSSRLAWAQYQGFSWRN